MWNIKLVSNCDVSTSDPRLTCP